MGFDVKNTTFFSPLDLIAPFTCRSCGRLGGLLCGCCKKYNISQIVRTCPRCGKEHGDYISHDEQCEVSGKVRKDELTCRCEVPVYAVAYREGVMMQLVEDFKYKSIRATAGVLAELMDAAIPSLIGTSDDRDVNDERRINSEVVVVPLPTIKRHIRERGFDHTWLLAKKLAKRRNFEVKRILKRKNKTVQVGANEETRYKQVEKAYEVTKKRLRGDAWGCCNGVLNNEAKLDMEKTYLLIDDVWTTGASMEAAISVLRKAGARKIVAAVILIPKR